MPQIAQAVAEPLSNVGNITMYGDGNSSKLVQDIMLTVDKISQGLGVDVHKLLSDLTSKVAD